MAVDALALSPYNDKGPPARPLFLCDCTLREGEQSAGAAFGLEERLRIARLLDEMGVAQIQVGYPGVSEEDREMARTLARAGLRARIEGIAMLHVDDWLRHVEAGLSCELDVLGMQFGISPIRLREVLRMSEDQVVDRVARAIRHAKERGAFVSFSPTDTTRADEVFLLRICGAAVEAGVDRLRLLDSMGAASPAAIRYLVALVKGHVSVPVGIHTHNDLGLALANSLAGVEAGADWVDVVANGLGERAGNTSLQEMAVVLQIAHGYDLGIDLSRLCELGQLMSEISGVPIPANAPIIGPGAFAHQLDTHVMGVARLPSAYEPYPPELVGNRRRFPLGRLSGPHAVRLKARQLGLEIPEESVSDLVQRIRQRAVALRRPVSEEEFLEMARGVA